MVLISINNAKISNKNKTIMNKKISLIITYIHALDLLFVYEIDSLYYIVTM